MATAVVGPVRRARSFDGFGDRAVSGTARSGASGRRHSFVIWFALIGILFPPVLVSIGGVNFTPGRFVVLLLLLPACGILLGRSRSRVASDFFAAAAASWILASAVLNGGLKPYVGAEALEFLGAYLVGRAFVFGPSNFQTFVRALKAVTLVLVALAVLDILAGRYITLDSFGVPNSWAMRFGIVRASSVLEGAEHYGTFCVIVTAIFLYSERGGSRIFYVGVGVFGCGLSLSSGPFLGLLMVMSIFFYDNLLKRYAWRWKALNATIAILITSIFLISNHPIAWMLTHFTLDPQTGFFRLGTWNAALPIIGESPFVGHGIVQLGDSHDELLFLRSVDCLWLLEALRYGLPGVILLAMTMFSSLVSRPSAGGASGEQTGLTVAIVVAAFIGLTVHFWDATWLLLNLCVGIRASFVEYRLRESRRTDRAVCHGRERTYLQHPTALDHRLA